jgi:putative transposase
VYDRRRFLEPPVHKKIVRDQLKVLVAEFNLKLAAWVILDNHSHILIRSHHGSEISRFVGRWHGRTSHELNRLDGQRGRQVWHNYWDTCIRSEADYWKRFNYIHYNPIKHGYVGSCEDWAFSSHWYYREYKGEEWLTSTLERYPVIDVSDPNDRFDGS